MAEVIKLNYPAMQEMSQQCLQVAERLGQTGQFARQIANQLQAGAMVGDAGEAFANALTSSLVVKIQRLSEKFQEISRDIQGAIQDMQSQDQQAGGRFR
jgi:WXG100 family type VII secretion target